MKKGKKWGMKKWSGPSRKGGEGRQDREIGERVILIPL